MNILLEKGNKKFSEDYILEDISFSICDFIRGKSCDLKSFQVKWKSLQTTEIKRSVELQRKTTGGNEKDLKKMAEKELKKALKMMPVGKKRNGVNTLSLNLAGEVLSVENENEDTFVRTSLDLNAIVNGKHVILQVNFFNLLSMRGSHYSDIINKMALNGTHTFWVGYAL